MPRHFFVFNLIRKLQVILQLGVEISILSSLLSLANEICDIQPIEIPIKGEVQYITYVIDSKVENEPLPQVFLTCITNRVNVYV